MTQIRRIIREYFNRTHNLEVHQSFVHWLRNGQLAKEKDDALREVWDELEIAPDRTTKSSFKKLQQRISPELALGYRRTSIKPLHQRLLRIASIFLIPAVSFTMAYLYVKSSTPETHYAEWNECFVPYGEVCEIILPDSSVVHVNSGSILIYPETFSGKTRDLYINGEASFTVTPNTAQPFVVKTADMDIEVLGTVFNVSSYNTDNKVSTTLESGKVNVRLKNEKTQSFILKPNDRISLDRTTGLIHIEKVNIEDISPWKKGYLVVEALTITDISKILERKHNVVIHIASDKYAGQRITAKFKNNESLTESLSVLQQLMPGMQYKFKGNIIYIY